MQAVEPDNRPATLQLHLSAARAARDAGDRDAAIANAEAALLIDPDFIAARLLRESLDDVNTAPRPQMETRKARAVTRPNASHSTDTAVSFEARIRQRRIDHQIGAARSAIADRRFADAAATLDELFELDPALPATGEIAAELAAAVVARRRRRLLPPVGAASAVVGVVLGLFVGRQPQWRPAALLARSPERAAVLTSRPLPAYAATVTGSSPLTAVAVHSEPPVADAVSDDERTAIAMRRTAPEAAVSDVVADLPAGEPSAVAGASVPVTDDTTLIREALQRYRRAYNGLDSRLAHAVYPGVDEAALAHAFDSLRSQSIAFDACTLDTRTDSARAVCRGSARYVLKSGNTTSRAEPKVWTFRLDKNDGDWTITSAWTDR